MNFADKDGVIYCTACYGKEHGPKVTIANRIRPHFTPMVSDSLTVWYSFQ
jgi:hypothetical protein